MPATLAASRIAPWEMVSKALDMSRNSIAIRDVLSCAFRKIEWSRVVASIHPSLSIKAYCSLENSKLSLILLDNILCNAREITDVIEIGLKSLGPCGVTTWV